MMRTLFVLLICTLLKLPSATAMETAPLSFFAESDSPETEIQLASAQFAAGEGIKVIPYGSLWGSMVYANQRTNPGTFTLYVLSEDQQDEDVFFTDARRSRFGFNIEGPTLPTPGELKSGGKIELDFIGEFVDSNRAHARLRHIYWEAKNESHRFLVGQTWDVISPLFPRTLNFSVGWLGGNMGFRRAQFRYEHSGKLSDDLAWLWQASLNEGITADFPTDAGVVREASNYPVLETRGAISLNPDAGARASTLGLSAHVGETGFDFLDTGPPPINLPPVNDARFLTWSYNFDLSVPIGERTHLQAEFFHGKNLSAFFGGIGQGVCPCTRTPIESIGGWGDLQYAWNEWLNTHVGYGIDDPQNDDFLIGRTLNQFIFANAIVMLSPELSTGLEVSYWRTLYKDDREGLIPPDQLGPMLPGKAVIVEWMVRYDF